jgi:hypothetical protein
LSKRKREVNQLNHLHLLSHPLHQVMIVTEDVIITKNIIIILKDLKNHIDTMEIEREEADQDLDM